MAVQGAWSFNEGTGATAADTSGNGRTATNVLDWAAAGHTHSALHMSGAGTGARVSTGVDEDQDPDMHQAGTIMCWVKLDSLPTAGQHIFSFPRWYQGDNSHVLAVSATGLIRFATGAGSTTLITTTTTLLVGQWYHVALSFDWESGSGAMRSYLYVNGVLAGTGTTVYPMQGGILYWGGMSSPLDGELDDARWYNEMLSVSEIQTLMNTPVPGPLESTGTTRFMKANDGSWVPVWTQRIITDGDLGSTYGWQLTKTLVGLNKYGINGSRLPEYTGSSKPIAGAVIRRKRITKPLDLSNGNITIDTCFVQPKTVGAGLPILSTFNFNTVQPGNGPVTITDCTIDGSALTLQQSAGSLAVQVVGTVTGNYIRGFGSGIAVMGVGTQYNTTIEHNYVTALTAYGDPDTDGNHSDAFTVRDFSIADDPARQLIVRNNRFDCSSGNDTGACFIQTSAGNIYNVTLEGNLLEGGGYNLGLNQMGSNTYGALTATNNRFTPTGFGTVTMSGGAGFSAWTENYLNDANQTDNKGAVVTAP